MKFKTLGTIMVNEQELQEDYKGAIRKDKVRFGERCMYISHPFNVEYIPYESIARVFRQVEDVRAKICCGMMLYEIHKLVIINEKRETKVLFEAKEMVNDCIEIIQKRNPMVCVGKKVEEKIG